MLSFPSAARHFEEARAWPLGSGGTVLGKAARLITAVGVAIALTIVIMPTRSSAFSEPAKWETLANTLPGVMYNADDDAVTFWQHVLSKTGKGLKTEDGKAYTCSDLVKSNGKFDDKTRALTIAWQKKHGVKPADGEVNGTTWVKAAEALNKLGTPDVKSASGTATFKHAPTDITITYKPATTIKDFTISFPACGTGKTVKIKSGNLKDAKLGPNEADEGSKPAEDTAEGDNKWKKFPMIGDGSTGNVVRLWQRILVADGKADQSCNVFVDGYFGSNTTKATKDWQDAATGKDGIVGPKTWGKAWKKRKGTDPSYTYGDSDIKITYDKNAKAKWSFTDCDGSVKPVTYGKGKPKKKATTGPTVKPTQIPKVDGMELTGAKKELPTGVGELRRSCQTKANPQDVSGFGVELGLRYTKSKEIKSRYIKFTGWGGNFDQLVVNWTDSAAGDATKKFPLGRDFYEEAISQQLWVPLDTASSSYKRSSTGNISVTVTGVSASGGETPCQSQMTISQADLDDALARAKSGTKPFSCEFKDEGVAADINVPFTSDKVGPISVKIDDKTWAKLGPQAVNVNPNFGKADSTTTVTSKDKGKWVEIKGSTFSKTSDFTVEIYGGSPASNARCEKAIKHTDLK